MKKFLKKMKFGKKKAAKMGGPAKPWSVKDLALWQKIAAVLVLVAIAVGGAFGVVQLLGGVEPEEPVAEEPLEPEEEPEPSLKYVGELEIPASLPVNEQTLAAQYHVSAELPRILSIPSVGIYARVTTIGKVNGAVGTPTDLRMVAWYNRSQLPGQPGAALMDAHGGSDGQGHAIGNGIFNNLVYVKPGEEIFIEMGDETTRYAYKVTEVLWLQKGTEANSYMKTALKPVETGEPTLTLITCAGGWIASERTFTHRVFVRAVLEYE